MTSIDVSAAISQAATDLATAQNEAGIAAVDLRAVAASVDWRSEAAGHFHARAVECAGEAERIVGLADSAARTLWTWEG